MTKPLWAIADAAAAPQLHVVDGWTEIARLVPADVGVVPQYAIRLPDGWALTQGRDNATGSNATDDLILTRFTVDGRRVETRTVLRGGHGDRAYCVDGRLVVQVEGVWSRITFGSPWSWKRTSTPPRCKLRAEPGCQGEAAVGDDTWLRLYGESIKGGAERDPENRPAFLQVIDGTQVVRTVSLDRVARDDKGNPLGGRYEPEGVSVADLNGVPHVFVGFSVGRLGNTTMRVYARPLEEVLS